MIGGIYFAGAAFAGVVGVVGPLPVVPTDAGIIIGGIDVTARVRVKGVTIHDILNDAPNTAQLTVEGAAPAVGQPVQITIGPRLIFGGAIQTTHESYGVTPDHPAWDITAIDDTGLANARRPFGTFVDVSATTVAQTITTTYAPGFATTGITAGLPPVRIVFDGADTFIACLTRLATAVGGYCKIEDRTVYLFLTDTSDPPQPIDPAHCFLHDPPIALTTDVSQLRTRVYGKGYGEAIRADLLAGETLIPIEDGALFPPAGGTAILGLTPDGAQSEQIAFASVTLGGPGTLVGPGAAPGNTPSVSLAAGTGVESGDHDYAYVFVTAAGRTLPSPRARVAVGLVPVPITAPTPGTPSAGGSLDAGTHRYYAVYRTAAGATLPGPVSAPVTIVAAQAAPPPLNLSGAFVSGNPAAVGVLFEGNTYFWKVTLRRTSDAAETDGSTATGPVGPTFGGQAPCDLYFPVANVPTPPAGFSLVWYRQKNGGTFLRCTDVRNLGATWADYTLDAALGPAIPATNGTVRAAVPLTSIPVSPAGLVTHVDLYREFNNAGAATARLAVSVTHGTTTATDTLSNAGLGALVPATNTAAANRVNVTWSAGPTGVTSIEVYRTAIGSTQLKQLHTVATNTAGTFLDGTPDASLTTNAPTSDTSGLTQPQGQVNPGAPALPVASPAPFRSAGGWVILGGGQVVRYTGITGQTLSGIPAAGAGAITTTVLYGSQALPAPMLVDVTGLTRPVAKGSAVHLWIQRDDLPAQAAHAARTGGDGIVEYLIVDLRRGVASLTARCDADLALFSRPLVTVTYTTHDLTTKSGKQIVVNLPPPLAMQATLTIQDVTISKLDIVPDLPPLFTVTASSVRFSLEDTLRRLIAGGQIVGGST